MIQVIERAFSMLEAMAKEPRRIWAVGELARLIPVQSTTAYYIVNSLVELGYVEKLGMRRGYRLGAAANRLCHNPVYRPDLVEAADSPLRDFVVVCRERVHISVMHGNKRFLLCQADPDARHTLQVNYNPISIEDLLLTPSGMLLLAHRTREEQLRFFRESGLPESYLWPELGTAEKYCDFLADVRKKPMLTAPARGGTIPIVFPVYEPDGERLAAVLGCVIPHYRFEGEHRGEVLEQLFRTASAITEGLKFHET